MERKFNNKYKIAYHYGNFNDIDFTFYFIERIYVVENIIHRS